MASLNSGHRWLICLMQWNNIKQKCVTHLPDCNGKEDIEVSTSLYQPVYLIILVQSCPQRHVTLMIYRSGCFITKAFLLNSSCCMFPFVMYGLFPMHMSSSFTFCCSQVTFWLLRRLSFVLLKYQLCLRRKTLLRSILKSLRRHVRSFLSGEKSENSSRFREPGLDFSCLRMCDIFVYVYLLSCSWHSPQWHVSNAHVIRQWLYF